MTKKWKPTTLTDIESELIRAIEMIDRISIGVVETSESAKDKTAFKKERPMNMGDVKEICKHLRITLVDSWEALEKINAL